METGHRLQSQEGVHVGMALAPPPPQGLRLRKGIKLLAQGEPHRRGPPEVPCPLALCASLSRQKSSAPSLPPPRDTLKTWPLG